MTEKKLQNTLELASEVLLRIEDGASIDKALAINAIPPELKPAVQGMVYETMRNFALAGAFLKKLAKKAPPLKISALLKVALVQLALSSREEFTVVNEAVKAAKKTSSNPGTAKFVNAVLRNFCRNKESLLKEAAKDSEVAFNAPSWWVKKYRQTLGAKAKDAFAVQRKHPPMSLRVNCRKTDRDAYLQSLRDLKIEACPAGQCAVILKKPLPASKIPGFSEGMVSVQDEGSQRAALILQPKEGSRVLDACAAPGGKTCHLLELANCEVTALEIDPSRTEKIRENLTRLEFDCKVASADAADTKNWWDGNQFDQILLDAPCSASGIVRRQPDIPWSRRPKDIPSLAETQKKLLDNLWPLLKEGGEMLYAVCSVFPEEGTNQIRRFLERHPDALKVPFNGADNGELLLEPTEETLEDGRLDCHDGFFYCLMRKEKPLHN